MWKPIKRNTSFNWEMFVAMYGYFVLRRNPQPTLPPYSKNIRYRLKEYMDFYKTNTALFQTNHVKILKNDIQNRTNN